MAQITGKAYIPNRGDIIVFTERGLAGPDGTSKQLIKRVIGVPGDRVIIEGGNVLIKNKEKPDGFNPDKTLSLTSENFVIHSNEQIDEFIDDGEVFVLGDNRGNSMDSRVFGPVNAEDIIGRLSFRIFPIQSAEKF
jgi:signal peptidase I